VKKYRIILEPSGLRILIDERISCLQAIRKAGLYVPSECGGNGTCGKCRVIINPSPQPTHSERKNLSAEEIDTGIRLACEQVVTKNLGITLLKPKGMAKILSEAPHKIEGSYLDIGHEGEYGVAIDIGTTSLVAYLMNLKNGHQISLRASLNPQIVFGEDVITRMTAASKDKSTRQDLQNIVIDSLEKMMKELCHDAHISQENITECSIVGNSVMHHLVLGLDTSRLGIAPYIPESLESRVVNSGILGFSEFNARIYFGPLIGGFVGSDITALILSQQLEEVEGIVLAIDIGTNGEIVLSNSGELFACSTAAGSALEGATISRGMRGQNGAIERFSLNSKDEVPDISVIGQETPIGLCGSGIVDVVAELLKANLISPEGKLFDSQRTQRDSSSLISYKVVDRTEYGLTEPILFTQKDIRQVQLAKAAITAGTKILLNQIEARPNDINQVLLAGAFGNYINPLSALRIGLIPPVNTEIIQQVGNTAGIGAKMMLLSSGMRQRADRIAENVKHVELSKWDDFESIFIQSTIFPS